MAIPSWAKSYTENHRTLGTNKNLDMSVLSDDVVFAIAVISQTFDNREDAFINLCIDVIIEYKK